MAGGLRLGAVSGAHLNPAVSLAFALRGDFPWKRVAGVDEACAFLADKPFVTRVEAAEPVATL